GTFGWCSAEALYDNRIYLGFVTDLSGGLWLYFQRLDWNYPTGGPVPASLRIDGQLVFAGSAKALQSDFLWIAARDSLRTPARLGNQLQATFDGPTFTFNLVGTNTMFGGLTQCVNQYRNVRIAAATPATGGGATSGSSGGGSNSPGSKTPAPRGATGTGFVLTTSGHIITNNHVVDACSAITITAPGEPAITASLVARDESNDLALLKAKVDIAES